MTMYQAIVNSPATTLTAPISDGATTIELADVGVLPDAPNLATIGKGDNAETILYTGKSGNNLTGVTRAFQGIAQVWGTGTNVARYFTAYDHDTFITNITALQTGKADQTDLTTLEDDHDELRTDFDNFTWLYRDDVLKAGTLEAGYYGKVNGMITGTELETETGLTAGTLAVSGDITFLKFAHKYKTLFVADRGIKHTISWDSIQAQDLVKGKVIEINGRYYLVRLMTGGNSNPASSAGGEWDDLIVAFTPNDEDSNWSNRTLIAEASANAFPGRRLVRGFTSVSEFAANYANANTTANVLYYRPALELL